MLYGQVPVVLGAPNIAEHLPAGSYIDVTDFPSAAALVAHLKAVDADPAAYARYHAWRTASFETYGVFLRRELLRWIGVAHHAHQHLASDIEEVNSQCFRCSMCYNLNEWGNATGWLPPFDGSRMPEQRIPVFKGSCTEGWDAGIGRLPYLQGWDRPHVTAAEFYARLGAVVPAAIADGFVPR